MWGAMAIAIMGGLTVVTSFYADVACGVAAKKKQPIRGT